MGQSVFTWVIIYDNCEEKKDVEQHTCTWSELVDEISDREPIAIIQTDTHIVPDYRERR